MLYRLFEKTARDHAQKTALVYGATRISYESLLQQVRCFAANLISSRVNPEDCVVLMLPNCPSFVVAMFAGLARGATLLPLNRALKDEALAVYLTDAQPLQVICGQEDETRVRRLIVDNCPEADLCAVPDNTLFQGETEVDLPPDEGRALYLYTSGSEGYRKRVCRTRENLYYESMNFVTSARLTSADTVACLVPLYHSYGLGNGLLAAIGSGATLVLLAPVYEQARVVEVPFVARCRDVLELLEREQVRLLVAVAYQYDALAQVPDDGHSPRRLDKIRWAVSSGGRLPLAVFEAFLERFAVPVRQLYGSTETGSVSMNLTVGSEFRPELVGPGLDRVEILIRDEAGRDLPAGKVGMVYIASPVLPQGGYDAMPEATAAAFHDGVYRTGDMGLLDKQGNLRIMGRKQTFIETGGYKVDPKKVEDVLARHPDIKRAVVFGLNARHLGQVVKAVVEGPAELSQAEVLAYCSEHLASYECPRFVDIRDKLPRDALGKIVKEALVGGTSERETAASNFVLDPGRRGSPDQMVWRISQGREPGKGEVLVQVLAVGLSFLDAQKLSVPESAEKNGRTHDGPGSGCCGRILALGPDVGDRVAGDLAVGDEVVMLHPGCLAGQLCVPAALVAPKPSCLSVEQAAALPFPYMTAHHALTRVAQLKPEERLLIYAAPGGLGLAAVQVGHHLGATVFASADKQETRDHLDGLQGVEVVDSSNPDFKGELATEWGRQGLDVVLNSLSGAYIAKGLNLLRNGGRFVELGQADYRADNQLGLKPFLRGLSFSLVDLPGMVAYAPEQVGALLREVTALADAGVYRPRIDWDVPASEIRTAFNHLLTGTQIGNVVVDLRDRDLQLAPEHAEPAKQVTPLVTRLGFYHPDRRLEALRGTIRGEIGRILRRTTEELPLDESFRAMGLDSLSTIVLQNRLSELCDLNLSVVFIWEHPTIDQLSAAVLARLDFDDAAVPQKRMDRRRGPRRSKRDRRAKSQVSGFSLYAEPIAVVGIGCRLPGGVDSPESFWDLLLSGRDPIGPVPAERGPEAWKTRDGRPIQGGFLEGVADFDAGFFGIGESEALMMDPQQRLLLELSWEALEDAAIAPDSLRTGQTGVYLGMSFADYGQRALYGSHPDQLALYSSIGNLFSMAAGRISYHLGLHGPSLTLDTACSSALSALHHACIGLHADECDLALVGGVNLMLAPNPTLAMSSMEALAADSRCKVFDAAADGIVRSEAGAMLVLKPLNAAMRDGDRIYASIRGSACNHDGRSNGLTAPSGKAQKMVIRHALHHAGVRPEHIDYVEAHGTGTRLGDPIEIAALADVYREGRSAEHPLILGSVKSNIGHTEACAGAAGFIKTALALSKSVIPANLHFRQPNPMVPWNELPLRVADEARAWPVRGNRHGMAGVSAFGMAGTNVHVILEQIPPR
ncbi:AMP-binding protein [Sulfidibacter corallicola]|uniref:AMP-binding protein n=1 Tax=Sulfidibacter corallicola TaxID=2818388 RepID=A0A8A4U1C5_SULCO|nr:beta-ketoacyl synthase N-terminal-like domain-containing protein [Sulfidibacter corallicola]QTD52545.1 AMP-binding protein [Sulfidibacter corallicola]